MGNTVVKEGETIQELVISSGVTLVLPYAYESKDSSGNVIVDEDGNPVITVEKNTIKADGSIEAVYHNSNSSNTPAAERNPMRADLISLHLKDRPTVCPYDNCQDALLDPDSTHVCTHTKVCTFCDGDVCNLCSSKVILGNGVKLVIDGTVLISGQLDGGGAGNEFTGQTGGYYAQLVLGEGSSVTVYGKLHVPGFITEVTDGKSSITVMKSGTIYQPFVIRDFKGGTITGSIYHSITDGIPYSPFNEFSTMNVYAKMYVYGSAIGYANIYADNKQNATISPLIGRNSNFLIVLTKDDSYVVIDHNTETDVQKLDFYGGAQVSAFQVTVQVPILGALTMTSKQFIFPIGWMYDITLHDGEYYMQNGNRFKLLPGAKFTVESDATLDIAYLTVYSSFTAESAVKHYPRKYQNIQALFIVNGTVIADELGGKVYTTGGNANLTVRQSTSTTIRESLTYSSNTDVIAGVLISSSGRVKTAFSTATNVTLHYMYSQNDEVLVNDFSGNGSIRLNAEYVSDNVAKSWKQNRITVDVTLKPGMSVTLEDGTVYTATSGEIIVPVEVGTKVIFTLQKNQLLVTDNSTSISVNANAAIITCTSTYTVEWTVSKEQSIKVYEVPKLTIVGYSNVTRASSTITYSLNSNSLTGTITVVEIKSVGSGWTSQGKSFKVNGVSASASSSWGVYTYTYKHSTTITSETTLTIT